MSRRPHVVAVIDLFHLHLSVDVTVGDEVGIGAFDLWDSVFVTDHGDNVVERKERMALDLGEDVLAHGAAGEQLGQLDVVEQGAGVVHAVPFAPHHLQEVVEGGSIIGSKIFPMHVVGDTCNDDTDQEREGSRTFNTVLE